MYFQIKFHDGQVYVFADEDEARAWYVTHPRAIFWGTDGGEKTSRPVPETDGAIWSERAKQKAVLHAK